MENQLSTVISSSGEDDQILERAIDIRTHQQQESSLLLKHVYEPRKRRQMHRVLSQLKLKKHQIEHVYDPVIVSLGPYHHGNSKDLEKAEKLKFICVDWFSQASKDKENLFYSKIVENIEAIRSSYAEISTLEKYSDEDLARMMLRDACFVINYIANVTGMKMNNMQEWQSHFGFAAFPFMLRDIMKLENQVPFLVIKLLISLQQGKEWEALLHKFLIWLLLRDGSEEPVTIPREHDDPPLHLLEAVWRAITESDADEEKEPPIKKIPPSSRFGNSKFLQKLLRRLGIGNEKKNDSLLYHSQRTFRSVMDLKAKGIYFSPSSSYSLKVVRFKSYSYFGELQLPVRYVSDQHQVILSNLIAYELSPDTANTDYTVLSYAILMKSLIESPEDVKELQKRGILFNKYSNHEQVVKSFKDIDTLGLVHLDAFSDVKEKIGEHCRSRAKTWTADLIHTRLQSPWSVLALFGAALVLCFTALQTFYAINHLR